MNEKSFKDFEVEFKKVSQRFEESNEENERLLNGEFTEKETFLGCEFSGQTLIKLRDLRAFLPLLMQFTSISKEGKTVEKIILKNGIDGVHMSFLRWIVDLAQRSDDRFKEVKGYLDAKAGINDVEIVKINSKEGLKKFKKVLGDKIPKEILDDIERLMK